MWYYNDKEYNPTKEDLKLYHGFVYELTDLTNNKKYIGKKKFWSKHRLAPLKGKKRRRTKISESDWQDYVGSNDELQAIVEEFGPDRVRKDILRLCKTSGEMSYFEAKLQLSNDVLLKPDEYYNRFVGLKCHANHVKHLIETE